MKNLEAVVEEWNDRKYRVEQHGQDPSVIILGEDHYTLDHIRKQFGLVYTLKPQYVLYEPMGGWRFDPEIGLLRQEDRAFAEGTYDDNPEKRHPRAFEWWEQFARNGHFEIIGCDSTVAEEREKAKELGLKLPVHCLTDNDAIRIFREEQMVRTVVEYQHRHPLIIMVVGASHGKNIHQDQLLQDRGFGYIHIDQTTMSGYSDASFIQSY